MKIRKKTIFLNLAIFVTLFLNAQEYAMNLSDVSNDLDYKEVEKKIETPLLENKKFTYKYQGKKVLVVFSDSVHIEYFNNKKYFIKSKVSWESKYECSMKLQESNLPNFPFKIGSELSIKITKVKRGYIYYDSTLGGRTWSGKMKEI